MKILLGILSYLSLNSAYCQVRNVNVDSIVNHCQAHFTKDQDFKHLSESFSVYKSKDKSEAIHIYLDSTGNLAEYIGLCILYYKYDSLQRVRSIEGWNSKGEPYYWDFADLTTFEYLDYSNSKLIRKLQDVIRDFKVSDTTSFELRITKEINVERDKKHNQTNYEIRSTDGAWSLRYYSKPAKGIRTVCDSAWFVLKHRDAINTVDKEYFIGLDTTLIDGEHLCYGYYSYLSPTSIQGNRNSPRYSYAIKFDEGRETGIRYYNSSGILVYAKVLTSGPIGKP